MSQGKKKYSKSTKLWASYASTILSTTLAMLLFGMILVIIFGTINFSNEVKENIGFKVNLLADTSEGDAIALRDSIAKSEFVKSVRYVSKEEAARIFTKELGEDFVAFIGENPLYPSIIVNLKAHIMDNSMNHIDSFVKSVASNRLVTDVEYDKNIVSELHGVINKVTYVLMGFAFFFLFISITLVSNTIRISLYSKRFIIRTMLLVGARVGFIIRPFLLRAIRYGFLGGFFAVVILGTLLYYVGVSYPGIIDLRGDLTFYLFLACGILFFGVLLVFISTYFSVKRYIKMKVHKFY